MCNFLVEEDTLLEMRKVSDFYVIRGEHVELCGRILGITPHRDGLNGLTVSFPFHHLRSNQRLLDEAGFYAVTN